MAWPSTRFEALYKAHTKRKAVEAIEQMKLAMVSGIWANTNLDDEKSGENKRGRLLEEVEHNHEVAVKSVYSSIEEKKAESDIDWSNPFFSAMKVPGGPEEDSPEAPPVPDRTTTTDLAEAGLDQV